MGAGFYFYGLTYAKKEEYQNLINQNIEDYDLQEWLEENTDIKEVSLCISYGSTEEINDWLYKYSKNQYMPDDDVFFEIDKSENAEREFLNLYWIKEKWINPSDVWIDNITLIVLKEN